MRGSKDNSRGWPQLACHSHNGQGSVMAVVLAMAQHCHLCTVGYPKGDLHTKTETMMSMCVNVSLALTEKVSQCQNGMGGMYLLISGLIRLVVSISRGAIFSKSWRHDSRDGEKEETDRILRNGFKNQCSPRITQADYGNPNMTIVRLRSRISTKLCNTVSTSEILKE